MVPELAGGSSKPRSSQEVEALSPQEIIEEAGRLSLEDLEKVAAALEFEAMDRRLEAEPEPTSL